MKSKFFQKIWTHIILRLGLIFVHKIYCSWEELSKGMSAEIPIAHDEFHGITVVHIVCSREVAIIGKDNPIELDNFPSRLFKMDSGILEGLTRGYVIDEVCFERM